MVHPQVSIQFKFFKFIVFIMFVSTHIPKFAGAIVGEESARSRMSFLAFCVTTCFIITHLCYMLILATSLEFTIPIFKEHTDSRIFHCHFSIFFLTIMEYLEQLFEDVYSLDVILYNRPQ